MPISWLDVILIVIMLISGFLAMVRGFTREVLSIFSWAVAAVAALYLTPKYASVLDPYINNPMIAQIAFAAGVNTVLDQMILLFFVGCGVSRLARYNVTAESLSAQSGRVEYFEGTPIPTSVVPLGLLMLAFYGGSLYRVSLLGVEWHAVALLFLVSGSLMISKTLRIPKP